MSRLFRPESVFFLLTLFALLVVFRERAMYDPGCLWHVRVGELVFARGFMWEDPFTFPFAGKLWIPQQWGGECLMAALHAGGGFDLMLLGFAVLVAGTFTWVFRRLLTGGMGPPLAGGVAVFALVCAGFHFYARPHMATVVFMAVTTGFIVDYDRGRVGVGRLAWLIPIHVVWTNIHGGMLGGVATLGLAAAGWTLTTLASGGRKTAVLGVWLVVLACGLTMFVNPFGLEMQRTWFRIVGSKAMAENVSEHMPLDLSKQPDQVVTAFAVFYLFLLLGTLPHRPRVTWLLPVVWFALTIKGIRQGPLFIVVAAVVAADVWPHTLWYRRLRKSGDFLATEPATAPGFGWAGSILPLLVVGILAVMFSHGPRADRWVRFDPKVVPVDMIEPVGEYMRSVPLGTPIYNDANFGGFLIYHAPELKIFMDDRFELCGDAWLADYVDVIENHPERFEGWYERYGFRRALVATADPPPPLEKYLRSSGKWREVARGEIAALYERVP